MPKVKTSKGKGKAQEPEVSTPLRSRKSHGASLHDIPKVKGKEKEVEKALAPEGSRTLRSKSRSFRPSKPGSEWTKQDLIDYNIIVIEEDEEEFFADIQADLDADPDGLTTALTDILNNIKMPPPEKEISESTRNFFKYLEHATNECSPDRPVESAVDDLATHIFSSVMGYDTHDRLIRRQMEVSLTMNGESRKAKPNIVILPEDNKIIFVDENKAQEDPDSAAADSVEVTSTNVEPQFVAETIAAVENNAFSGLVKKSHQEISGVVFIGAIPTLYRIAITTNLLTCLAEGKCPEESTILRKLIRRDTSDKLDERRLTFQYFVAFKKLITKIDSNNG